MTSFNSHICLISKEQKTCVFVISYDTSGKISSLYNFPQWKYSLLTLLHTYVQNKFTLQCVRHFCRTAHCISNITKCNRSHDDGIGDVFYMQRLFVRAQCRQFLDNNFKYYVFSTCQTCLRTEGVIYNT
jgi:hypothetical protein